MWPEAQKRCSVNLLESDESVPQAQKQAQICLLVFIYTAAFQKQAEKKKKIPTQTWR